jgi:hypothetical protein
MAYHDMVVLFPIAFLWVAIFLVWVIRKSTMEPDQPPPETRRFRRWPSGPRGGGIRSGGGARPERRNERGRALSARARASAPRRVRP